MKFAEELVEAELEWPARLLVSCELEPAFAFGGAPIPRGPMIALQGESFPAETDVLTGRTVGAGGHFLNAPIVDVEIDGVGVKIRGTHAIFSAACQSIEGVRRRMEWIHNEFANLLSAALPVPVDIGPALGRLAGVDFVVHPSIDNSRIRFVNPNVVANRTDSLCSLTPSVFENRRLLAAYNYLAQMKRLRLAGGEFSMFAGEIALNAAKAIEVLFTSTVDKIRSQCRLIGMAPESVRKIASLYYLRNTIDVGHSVVTKLSADDRDLLVSLIQDAEVLIEDMLSRTVRAVEEADYQLPKADRQQEGELDRRKTTFIEKVREIYAPAAESDVRQGDT